MFARTYLETFSACLIVLRPWHDVPVIACACIITHANQEKGRLGGR